MEEVPEKAAEDQDMGSAEVRDGCGECRCPAAGGTQGDGDPLFLSGDEAEGDREADGYQTVPGEIPRDPAKKLLGEYLSDGSEVAESVIEDDVLQAGTVPKDKAASAGNPDRKEES